MIINRFFKQNSTLYFIPFIIVLVYCLISSIHFNIHDFSNSYFSARLFRDGIFSDRLFDIYEFNNYIWNLGYEEALVDFYLNSPFTIITFYPLSFIENAYTAKLIFNIFSIILFLISMFFLVKLKFKKNYWILSIIPLIFFVPIRNQILFGQSYFLIFSLIIFSFLLIERKKGLIGSSLLSFAIMLKVFPVFYGIILLFNKNWKSIIFGFLSSVIILLLSIYFIGFEVWENYFLNILPNAIANNSTVDFRYNSQSIDVFLKTLFIEDPYYNPDAIFDSEQLFFGLKWVVKSIILTIALKLSFNNQSNLFKLLSIWIITLFLLQSRISTYSLILLIIPTISFLNLNTSLKKKILFLGLLFLICNIPILRLENLTLFFKFSRLWLLILLAFLFYYCLSPKFNYKLFSVVFLVLLPFHLQTFKANNFIESEYVLVKKEHFTVYDFFEQNKELYIRAIGREGNQSINTHIKITSFKEDVFEIENNQVSLNGIYITNDYSLKKKPVLINENQLYYLTDYRSRKGAYTLKKINIESIP